MLNSHGTCPWKAWSSTEIFCRGWLSASSFWDTLSRCWDDKYTVSPTTAQMSTPTSNPRPSPRHIACLEWVWVWFDDMSDEVVGVSDTVVIDEVMGPGVMKVGETTEEIGNDDTEGTTGGTCEELEQKDSERHGSLVPNTVNCHRINCPVRWLSSVSLTSTVHDPRGDCPTTPCVTNRIHNNNSKTKETLIIE